MTYDLAANSVSHNAWHHVAASFNSATFRLTVYLDGTQVSEFFVFSGTSLGNTSPVSIGRNGGGTANFWVGKLDDVRIWDVVRTQIEINSNYLVELSGSRAGLVGNWRFNEGSGTTAADSAGTAQDATLIGGAVFSTDTHFTAPTTPTPTPTPSVPVDTPTPSNTPTTVPTDTPIPTSTPTTVPTDTPVPTSTSTNTPVPTSTSTNTPVPTSTSTNTPVPTSTSTNTVVPTSTRTPTAVPTNTPTSTAVPATATRTSTPVPSATNVVPSATPTTQSAGGLIVAPTMAPNPIPFFAPVYQQPAYPIISRAPRRQNPTRPSASEPTATSTVTPTSEPLLLPPPPDSRLRAVVVAPGPVVVDASAPDPAPGDPNEDWLVILRPVQVYSVEMQPLWMAEAGEWYRVSWTEGGHALAVWEFDTNDWAVWIALDETRIRRVRIDADHPRIVSRLWLRRMSRSRRSRCHGSRSTSARVSVTSCCGPTGPTCWSRARTTPRCDSGSAGVEITLAGAAS